MGEHLPCKQGVKGSNPSISTGCSNSQMHLENRIYETILQNVQKCTYAKEKEDIKEVSLTEETK